MKLSPQNRQAHLRPGYRLDGRYELLYPHAQGGMAVVWAARVQGKHGFEKLVAVKTILRHVADDESFRTMFLDEARIAAGIQHPNVAQLEDLGEESGTLYMVLEWVEGDALSKLYQAVARTDQPFPLDLLLRIAADTCAGLHSAHELRGPDGSPLRVVHRDVSPQNLLVTTSGVTKLIDFGIAKARDRLSEQTRTGLLRGKAQYAAPEQARLRPVDRRADIWAVGVMLYEVVAGRPPFDGRTDLETLQNLASGKPPHPLPPSVPPAVAAIVMRALQHAPAARFSSALEMQRALEEAISRPTTASDVASFVQKHLGERIEARRRDLAAALEAATARAGTADQPPSRLLATARSSSHDLSAFAGAQGDEGDATDDGTTAAEGAPAFAPMRAVHWCVATLALLVTLGVWALVVAVILGFFPPGSTPAPWSAHDAPSGSWAKWLPSRGPGSGPDAG